MARPRKPPAFLVEATVRRNEKLADLPGDTARLGFFYVVLGEAKLADPPGQFASRGHFRELAGRFARWLDDYIRVGVLEVAPKLCKKCVERWASMPPKRGALVVHDWHDHQYDPRKLDRQREYEERQRDAVSDGVSDAQSDAVSDATEPEFPTLSSRAGPRDPAPGTSNVEPTNGISPEEDRSPSGVRERDDVAALRERGWKRVTKAQRRVLDEVLERHDMTGPAFAAGVIRATPDDRDPLQAVMDADRLWQEAQRHRAEVEESGWTAEKARERQDAETVLPWLVSRTG